MNCRPDVATSATMFILSRSHLAAWSAMIAVAGLYAAGCSPSASSAADMPQQAPLIVNSDGTDISDQKPAPAKQVDPAPTSADLKALASAASTAMHKPNESRKTKPAAQAAAAAAAGRSQSQSHVDDDGCKIAVSCSKDHDLSDAGALRPDSAKLQAIMNGKSKTALIEGQLYQVGDHFGPRECTWTVSTIDANSATLQKAQSDRTFAVTLYVNGTPKARSLPAQGNVQ